MTGLPHSQLHSHKKWLKQLYQIVFLASDRELIQLRKRLAGETKWCCLSECPPHLFFICTLSPGNKPHNQHFPTSKSDSCILLHFSVTIKQISAQTRCLHTSPLTNLTSSLFWLLPQLQCLFYQFFSQSKSSLNSNTGLVKWKLRLCLLTATVKSTSLNTVFLFLNPFFPLTVLPSWLEITLFLSSLA